MVPGFPGRIICLEAKNRQAGPLGRHPDGGRNWEGFSPDPVLTGAGMYETINGMQDAVSGWHPNPLEAIFG